MTTREADPADATVDERPRSERSSETDAKRSQRSEASYR